MPLQTFVRTHRSFRARRLCRLRRTGICYSGNPSVVPSRDFIDTTIENWTATGRAAEGYAIDFGVLRDGTTALVSSMIGTPSEATGLRLALS